MFTFIKKNLQIWMRLSTFANEKERNLIDMCTFKNINMYFPEKGCHLGTNRSDNET